MILLGKSGGRDRDRTGDPLLAKQVLSQLSYTPTVGVSFILKHFRARRNPFLRFSSHARGAVGARGNEMGTIIDKHHTKLFHMT
jgi:hypothetical protein